MSSQRSPAPSTGRRIATPSGRHVALAAAFVALAFLAFGPALRAPFDFDDLPAIARNASIRTIWPPTAALHPPADGSPVSGRPVVNFSFALNYAVNRGLGVAQSPATDAPHETIGYHVVNVLLHALCALLLAAVIRRALRAGRLPDEWRDASDRIAALAAGVWLLLPIQTEAVDYVSQRTELLVSVCYLATLYAAIRAWLARREAGDPRSAARADTRWSIAAVAFSLLGVGSKEVIITVPVAVMLYDRAFLADSWTALRGARSRLALYAALLATSALSVAAAALGARGTTVGFDGAITWYAYLNSQGWAIPHYVGLLFWPDALTMDYGKRAIHGFAGLAGLVALTAAGIATLVAWRRPRSQWLGFVGAWFFLLLAPSSSVVPIRTEIAAERRVYLASAAIVVMIVVAIEWLRRRVTNEAAGRAETRASTRAVKFASLAAIAVVYFAACGWTAARVAPVSAPGRWLARAGVGLAAALLFWCIAFARPRWIRIAAVIAVACAMITTTFERSALYDNLRDRWLDGIAKTPTNGRAYDNLASAELLSKPPNYEAADNWLQQAMTIDPLYIQGWVQGAKVASKRQRFDEAVQMLLHALQLHPDDAAATEELGRVLLDAHRPDLALRYLKRFAEYQPDAIALTNVGLAYLMTNQLDAAILVLTRAAQLDSASGNAAGLLKVAHARVAKDSVARLRARASRP